MGSGIKRVVMAPIAPKVPNTDAPIYKYFISYLAFVPSFIISAIAPITLAPLAAALERELLMADPEESVSPT